MVRVLKLERFSSPLYLKSREKNPSHSATPRIFSMLSSVMYRQTLCPVCDIRRSKNKLSCLRRKGRRGRPEEQISQDPRFRCHKLRSGKGLVAEGRVG